MSGKRGGQKGKSGGGQRQGQSQHGDGSTQQQQQQRQMEGPRQGGGGGDRGRGGRGRGGGQRGGQQQQRGGGRGQPPQQYRESPRRDSESSSSSSVQQQPAQTSQGAWGRPQQYRESPRHDSESSSSSSVQQQPAQTAQGAWGRPPPGFQPPEPAVSSPTPVEQHPQQQERGKGAGRGHQGRGKGKGQPHADTHPPPGFADKPPTEQPQRPQTTVQQQQQQQQKQKQQQIGDTQTSVEQITSPVSSMSLVATHKRRQGGRAGRPITIETNHLPLNLGKLKEAYHYDVTITPPTPKKLLRAVMERFRTQFYPDRYPAFDGVKNLYASKRLPHERIEGEVTITEDGRDKQFKVVVKFANAVDLSCLNTFLNEIRPDGRHLVTPQEAIQCIDVVLRTAPALNCISVGRSFFTPPRQGQIIDLGNGMEMYHGFYQSAILGWKPFLNVDVAHKGFPKNINLIDLINELFGREFRSRDDINNLQRYQIEKLSKFITTLKVQYEIPGNPASKRVYRVNGLKRDALTERFRPENKPEMTIEAYFRIDKRYPLKYPKVPCIWVGSRDRQPPILLPAELCTLTGGQVVNRKMDETQTSNMIRYAATSTTIRKEKIMRSCGQANFNSSPSIREFGFSVGDQFEQVRARVLDPPNLGYNKKSVRPSRGVWRADDAFSLPAQLGQWTIANWDRRTRQEKLIDFAKMMRNQARNMGMNMPQPVQPFDMIEARRGRELDDLVEFFKKKRDQKMNLVVVVIPDSGPYYAIVKQASELSVGCLTQCVKSKTMYKMNPSTVGNILLKVNAKLNGVNHHLLDRPRCLLRPCMIMGADVTHPSPDSTNVPSVAAVTASHDPKAFKYNICWRLQPPRIEIIEDLENIAKEQLMYFFKQTNGIKPESIIFFRDGVSEGQFQQVLDAEVQAIRRACLVLQKDGTYKPRITFLVVQKRHHTRFFPMNQRDSEDRNFNVPAGTCVDTVITHPTAQDFYLVSHASIQGVAKPTKYRTLWDDLDMTDDEIEQLSYYLCHLFARCNRSVSYPAPTYYAHLAAARAKVYCENREINLNNLSHLQSRLQIREEIVKDQPMFFV